eukprot:929889-Prymnesium_polylepis.1
MHSITACAVAPAARAQARQTEHTSVVTEGMRLRHAASRVCHRPVCCGDGTYGLPPKVTLSDNPTAPEHDAAGSVVGGAQVWDGGARVGREHGVLR